MCPDYILIGTKHKEIINKIFLLNKGSMILTKRTKGWLNNTKPYKIGFIKLYFQKNRFQEFDKLFIGFSPHLLANNNVHNASFLSFQESVSIIEKILINIGIERQNFCHLYISSIEIGLNFKVPRNAYFYLKPALMFGNWFLKNDKFKHYKYHEEKDPEYKYKKVKWYIKSQQIETISGKNYEELGYCDRDVMRFEIVLEKIKKFKFFDFSNLEKLYYPQAESLFAQFLYEEFEQFFFYSREDIKVKNLTNNELKHYHQWQVPGFWRNLDPAKRRAEKLFYDKVCKKVNIKNELKTILYKLIMGEINDTKAVFFYVKNHTKFPAYKIYCYKYRFFNPSILKDNICNLCLPIDIGNKIIFYKV